MSRNRHPSEARVLTAEVVTLVAEIRNPDIADDERVDAARLLIQEQSPEAREDLIALVMGSTGVISPGAADACFDAWRLERGAP